MRRALEKAEHNEHEVGDDANFLLLQFNRIVTHESQCGRSERGPKISDRACKMQATETLENAEAALQQRMVELASVQQRLSKACSIFSLQAEAENAAAKLKSAKRLLFPPPLVLAGPTGVVNT